MATSTHLIAPAEVFGGINRCPTSFSSFFPTKGILWTLYGHSVDGESKDYVMIWTSVA